MDMNPNKPTEEETEEMNDAGKGEKNPSTGLGNADIPVIR